MQPECAVKFLSKTKTTHSQEDQLPAKGLLERRNSTQTTIQRFESSIVNGNGLLLTYRYISTSHGNMAYITLALHRITIHIFKLAT